MHQAVPEGDTAYVMTVEENGENWLWNAVTGEHMTTNETFCPLESVHAIVNESEFLSKNVLITFVLDNILAAPLRLFLISSFTC